MTRSGRKRSLRSSSNDCSHNGSNVDEDVTSAADSGKVSKKGLKCHYYSTDDDEVAEIHILDGVEYKNYNDFVEAKRKRNEAYLQTLGFDSQKTKTTKEEKETPEPKKDKHEKDIKDVRLVSPPASSYYDRFETNEISLDAASLATDPFDQMAKLIMELETEIHKLRKRQGKSKEWSNTEEACKAESKTRILSLLHGILSHLSPSKEDPWLREKYIEAFQELEGVQHVLWLSDVFCWYNYENFDITGLCLEIIRDACCVSVSSPSKSSTSEKVALDLVKNETLEFLIELIHRSLEWLDCKSFKSKSRRPSGSRRNRARSSVNSTSEPKLPENHTDSPEVRRRKILETTSTIWGLMVNMTYFESVIAIMREYEFSVIDRLINMTHSSLAALDARVTQDLAKILPLPPTIEQPATAKPARFKKLQEPKSQRPKSKTQDIAQVTPEAIEKCKSIAMEASRVLEPIFGTIRNLIADPMTSCSDWEMKSFVSLILDIICKGEDGAERPQITTNENDWLHFITQSSGNLVPKDVPPPTLFRWVEQSEIAVWELLGVFKACLGKGILCTYTNDVERLVGFCLRCLRQFGTCSSRTTLRILHLVEGLITPSWNGFNGLTSAKVGIQKQILIREGFLDELVNLSGMYSSLHARGSLPSNGDAVRSEIESLIAKFHSN